MLFFTQLCPMVSFWGGGNSTHSKCVFKLQKRAIGIIKGTKNNDSCREFFKPLKILPLSAQYIYSLLMFVVNNRNLFLDTAKMHYLGSSITCQLP